MGGGAESPVVPAVVLEPTGAASARVWLDLERQALDRIAANARQFVVDLGQVQMINSAGLRLLMMLRQRLEATGGSLVLCELCESVRSVFDIAGLTPQFRIAPSRAEALGQLEKQPALPAAPRRSKLARLAGRLLEDSTGAERAVETAPPAPTGLAARVSALLTETSSMEAGA
jgi:anti-sigma B factor antagonist